MTDKSLRDVIQLEKEARHATETRDARLTIAIRGSLGLGMAIVGTLIIGATLPWWPGVGIVLAIIGWVEWKGHLL